MAQDPLARAGLAALLADQPGCEVVGQVGGEVDLSTALEVYHPDAVLWDLGWSAEASLERFTDLQDTSLPVVALMPDSVQITEAWSAGVRGFLLRDADASALHAALMAVSEGLTVLAPELSAAPPSIIERRSGSLPEELTAREMEVLQLLAEGLSNKSIAQRLSISEHTVKFHVNAIFGKLGAQSRTEAVIRATRLGLVLL